MWVWNASREGCMASTVRGSSCSVMLRGNFAGMVIVHSVDEYKGLLWCPVPALPSSTGHKDSLKKYDDDDDEEKCCKSYALAFRDL